LKNTVITSNVKFNKPPPTPSFLRRGQIIPVYQTEIKNLLKENKLKLRA